VVLRQESATRLLAFGGSPEGSPQKPPPQGGGHPLAFLANILDITCETRLVATVSVGSECYIMSDEVH